MNGKRTYSILLKVQSDLCYISYLYKARLDETFDIYLPDTYDVSLQINEYRLVIHLCLLYQVALSS